MKSLVDAVHDFLNVDRAPKTTASYSHTLTLMLDRLGPETPLQAIQLSHLLDYTKSLSKQVQPSSLYTYSLAIKSFFNWCERVEYLQQSPARRLTIRKPAPEVRTRGIPLPHARAILEVARKQPRDYALVLFISETAARIGAICALRTGDLDLQDGSAVLVEKRRKPVRVDFSPYTAAALDDWLKKRVYVGHDYVWTRSKPCDHRQFTVHGLTELLLRLSKQACGIEYSPHRWRHTLSERWEDLGLTDYEIGGKLNHADKSVTRDFYMRKQNPNVRKLSKNLPLVAFGGADEQPSNIILLGQCV